MISRKLALVTLFACSSFAIGQEGAKVSSPFRGLRGDTIELHTGDRQLGVGERYDSGYSSSKESKGKGGKGKTTPSYVSGMSSSKGKGGKGSSYKTTPSYVSGMSSSKGKGGKDGSSPSWSKGKSGKGGLSTKYTKKSNTAPSDSYKKMTKRE